MNGAPLDPQSVAVSTDFYAVVTITNTSGYERYADLALTHIVPAGWEITSERDLSAVTYQDIRDDRVLSYFDLRSGESKGDPDQADRSLQGPLLPPLGLLRGDVRQLGAGAPEGANGSRSSGRRRPETDRTALK